MTHAQRYRLADGLHRAAETYIRPVICLGEPFCPDGVNHQAGARAALHALVEYCYGDLETPLRYDKNDPLAPLRQAWNKRTNGLWAEAK